MALVQEHQQAECRGLLVRAREEAARIVREAYAGARTRLHRAVVRERQRALDRLRAAEAELHTVRRMYRQRRSAALLSAAWERLESEFLDRWAEPAGRKAWVAAAVERAFGTFAPHAWEITCPASWPEMERKDLERTLATRLAETPRFIPDEGLGAGLLIRSGGNVVDATLAGFLEDRGLVEGRLLALISGGETR